MNKNTDTLYPDNPKKLPNDFLKPSRNLIFHSRLAFYSLCALIVSYVVVVVLVSSIVVEQSSLLLQGEAYSPLTLLLSVIVSATMLKPLVISKPSDPITGVIVDENLEPTLFEFIRCIAADVGAPMPSRVYLTSDVNAAIVYNSASLKLFRGSSKDLVIGLPLLSQLNLSEIKAVIAHELGHFAQKAASLGRWFYQAQHIVGRLVAENDAVDRFLWRVFRMPTSIGGIFVFIAGGWFFWLIATIAVTVTWSIRSLFGLMFRVLLLTSKALSRELEFEADLIAVSVTGSEPIIAVLHKLEAIERSWNEALNISGRVAQRNQLIKNIPLLQNLVLDRLRSLLADDSYGRSPKIERDSRHNNRIFLTSYTRESELWRSHPLEIDRETNAKNQYIDCPVDDRRASLLLADFEDSCSTISRLVFPTQENQVALDRRAILDVLNHNFGQRSLNPTYNGCYLGRPLMRAFKTYEEAFSNIDDLDRTKLYPKSLEKLTQDLRSLDTELSFLRRVQEGTVSTKSGEVQHKGRFLHGQQLNSEIESIEKSILNNRSLLRSHDQLCRSYYQELAKTASEEYSDYHRSLVALLHYVTHTHARAREQLVFLKNLLSMAFADGKLTDEEMSRLYKELHKVHGLLGEYSSYRSSLLVPDPILQLAGPNVMQFVLGEYGNKAPRLDNFRQWLTSATPLLSRVESAYRQLVEATLDHLLEVEIKLDEGHLDYRQLTPARVPDSYPTLAMDEEREINTKLDWWSKFRMGIGTWPMITRSIVAVFLIASTMWLANFESSGQLADWNLRSNAGAMAEIVRICKDQSRDNCITSSVKRFDDSLPKFIEIVREACEKSNFRACGFLGSMYLDGKHTAVDTELAKRYLRKACDGDDGLSCTNLGILLNRSAEVSADTEVPALFEKACNLDDSYGCLNLAHSLLRNSRNEV